MTRRKLLIIIGLLVALDIATGFWYLAGHVNSDGKGGLFGDGDGAAAMADTLSDGTVTDKFNTISDSQYFVSKEPAIEDDASTYYSCIKRFKAKLPISVNGNNNVSSLMEAIAEKAFGASGNSNVETAGSNWLKTPRFAVSKVDYKVINSEPNIFEEYGAVEGVKIYPLYSSNQLLVMAVDKTFYNGHETAEQLGFVNFNRTTLSVITAYDIFRQSENANVLNLVNKKINQLNDDKGTHYSNASALPTEICPRKKGIFFVFPEGELADKSKGVIEILVEYKDLKNALTPKFESIIKNDANHHSFKAITFKK